MRFQKSLVQTAWPWRVMLSLRDRTDCFTTKAFGLPDNPQCQECGNGRCEIGHCRRQRTARLRVEGFDVSEGLGTRPFYWTTALQGYFREELEKCVVFRAVCRSERFIPVQACRSGLPGADRGLVNFMVRCRDIGEKAPIDTLPVNALHVGTS